MKQWLDNQYQNLFLYVPIMLACGAAIYFTYPYEPHLIFCILGAAITFILVCGRKIPYWIRAIILAVFGFCYAGIFTHIIDTPQLTRNTHDQVISATVTDIDYANDKTRLYLSVSSEQITKTNGTANIRVSINNDEFDVNIGDKINATVSLFKPSGAYAPGAFDYARWAYFNKLTATGYATDIEIVGNTQTNPINVLRDKLHDKSDSFLTDALVLGYKNSVAKSDAKIWTATGVGHIWSISGFHMTLVGGWLFIIFYTIFRAIPYVTRRIPAKIPALCGAWIGLIGYLFLSGLDVATLRAFLMTTLIFAAFICNRSVISMRNIALVFCIIFLLNPHYIMQAGFQLSFAAVFGLVWLYAEIKPKMPQNKFLRTGYAMVLTSVTAMIFTMPFVAIHFGAIPVYSLLGNLILLPIFSVAIMPLVIIDMVLKICGGGGISELVNSVYNFTLGIAEYISKLPMASWNVPHVSNGAIICFILGFVALIVIKNIKVKVNVILFAVLVTTGVIIVHTCPKPIFYATHDHELVGMVGENGNLEFNKLRASNHYFAFDTWKRMNGEIIGTPNKRRKHDQGVYRYENIVYIQKFVPLMNNLVELCQDNSVKYIVSYFDFKSNTCANKILRGGFVIYPNGTVRYTPDNRKWHHKKNIQQNTN